MKTLNAIELLHCHICSSTLRPHPLYEKSGAKFCTKHGDFFVYSERDKNPVVIFREFEKPKRSAKKKRITPAVKKVRGPGRPTTTIRCDQTGIVYSSLTEAARCLGIGQPEISKNLRGYDLTVGGYTFSKLVDDGTGTMVALPRPILPRNEGRYPIAIKCDQTGEIFNSIRKASETLNIPKTTIRYRLRRTMTYNVKGEYTFSRVTSQEIHGL